MSNVVASIVALAAVAGAALGPAAAQSDPLAPHRLRERVLVALAPDAADPDLARQRRIYNAMGRGARERDLVLVAATDGTPAGAALRRRFGGTGFRAVLVGKDGGAKLTSDQPLTAEALFPLIDSMPMRQDEMRKQD